MERATSRVQKGADRPLRKAKRVMSKGRALLASLHSLFGSEARSDTMPPEVVRVVLSEDGAPLRLVIEPLIM
jgi:hypothetical protein